MWSSESSKYVSRNETTAAPRRIRTSKSSNCSIIIARRPLGSSSSSLFSPYFSRASATCLSDRPVFSEILKCFRTASTVLVWGATIATSCTVGAIEFYMNYGSRVKTCTQNVGRMGIPSDP